jgi:TolB-like protein/AraC-like DNA-binding protein
MATGADSTNNKNNTSAGKNPLIRKLETEIESNLTNEQFGVEELAEKVGISRSHLHRKLQKITGQSISQFIREYRLRQAMRLLVDENKTISEIAYEVGFGSPSYFTKCFTDFYGYPPGETKRKLNEVNEAVSTPVGSKIKKNNRRLVMSIIGTMVLVLLCLGVVFLLYSKKDPNTVEARPIKASIDNSIAVLPFKNLNANQENQYFNEGVVQAINRHLSKIDDLKIISITATDQYRESNKSAKEISDELKVSYLLEGSLQRYENKVRIEVRLIDAKNENQLWAQNYDRELKDIFKTQSDIAEKIGLALKTTLTQGEKTALNRMMTENSQAYDLYLKGQYEYRTYTRLGNNQAIEYFKESIALDPNYALPYVGLASTYISRASIFGAELAALEALELAKPFLDKALALDPDLVEAHTWNAFYLLYKNWDFEGAEREYKKGITGNYPDALALYADFLNFVRRHDEALAISRKLDETEPYYPNTRMILSLFYTQQYDEADRFAQQRMRLFNNFYSVDSYGFLMLNTGNYEKAISLFQKTIAIEDIRYPRTLGWMGAAYARSGNRDEANKLIEELKTKRIRSNAGSLAFFIAVIHAALDEKESAVDWLEIAYSDHEMEIPWLKSEPQFFSLHDHPKFQELLDKTGFPK